MENKDPKIFLGHIRDSILQIRGYVEGMTEGKFMEGFETQDAVIRRLEIIGEAVKNIPEEFRLQKPNILWKKIAGFRDVLIHEYFNVDLHEVWNIVQNRLGELEDAVGQLLEETK